MIEGNYFQSIDGDPLKFSLIRRKLALIPAASVVFICDDDDIENSDVGTTERNVNKLRF
jgi:hypothetical protein